MTIAEENADLKSQVEALTGGNDEAQAKIAALGEQTDKLEKANAALIDKVAGLEKEIDEKQADQASVEVQPALDTLCETLEAAFAKAPGRALFIDYGPAGHAPGDTLRAFKDGQQVGPLDMPGESDLTVDVDFSRLARLAQKRGLDVAGPVEQGPFLLALGAEARMQALIKANPERAEGIYEGVRRLVDPAELGNRFKVICLSSPGLPPPAGF
jgi:SAM-dependent MidA family methyltransferase